MVDDSAKGIDVLTLCNHIMAINFMDTGLIATEHVYTARSVINADGNAVATSGWMGFALKYCKGTPCVIIDIGSGQFKMFEWDGEQGSLLKTNDEVGPFYERLAAGEMAAAIEAMEIPYASLKDDGTASEHLRVPIRAFATEKTRGLFGKLGLSVATQDGSSIERRPMERSAGFAFETKVDDGFLFELSILVRPFHSWTTNSASEQVCEPN